MGLLDLDGDQRDEVVMAASDGLSVFRAQADGWFEVRTPLPSPPQVGEGMNIQVGCESADIDRDGRPDVVVVSSLGGFVAFNRETGFVLVPFGPVGRSDEPVYALAALSAATGEAPTLFLAARTAGDAYGQGDDSFIESGCGFEADGHLTCGASAGDFAGEANELFSIDSTGAILPAVDDRGLGDDRRTMAFGVADLSRDGRQDVVVANDGGRNGLFLAEADGRYRRSDSPALARYNHGMGVAFADFDADGRVDLAVSEIGPPLVLRNDGDGFSRLGASRGFGRAAHWSWGIEAEDYDGDGDPDLALMNERLGMDQWYGLCRLCGLESLPAPEFIVYENDGAASFRPLLAFDLDDPATHRTPWVPEERFGGGTALASGDVDGDGRLDIVVLRHTESGQQPYLLRNVTDGGGIRVFAPQGAVVEACSASFGCRRREVFGARSFASVHGRWAHFGLGNDPSANVTVEWPVGTRHELGMVPAGGAISFRAP